MIRYVTVRDVKGETIGVTEDGCWLVLIVTGDDRDSVRRTTHGITVEIRKVWTAQPYSSTWLISRLGWAVLVYKIEDDRMMTKVRETIFSRSELRVWE